MPVDSLAVESCSSSSSSSSSAGAILLLRCLLSTKGDVVLADKVTTTHAYNVCYSILMVLKLTSLAHKSFLDFIYIYCSHFIHYVILTSRSLARAGVD